MELIECLFLIIRELAIYLPFPVLESKLAVALDRLGPVSCIDQIHRLLYLFHERRRFIVVISLVCLRYRVRITILDTHFIFHLLDFFGEFLYLIVQLIENSHTLYMLVPDFQTFAVSGTYKSWFPSVN